MAGHGFSTLHQMFCLKGGIVKALIAAFIITFSGSAGSEVLQLRPGISVYIAPEEPEALQLAVDDLLRDLNTVFGKPSQRISTLPDSGAEPFIAVFGPSATQNPGRQKWVTEAEAHCVFSEQLPFGGYALIGQGTDLRGAIYAVYTLSEEILGVPPMWVWSGWKPDVRTQITISANTDIRYESPSVRWRGWFPNDQDYLGPWLSRGSNLDLLAETMLRLKLNLWDTGSILDSDLMNLTAEAATASRRGIVSCSTHTSPLGVRLTDSLWEQFWSVIQGVETVPAMTDEEALQSYWLYAVNKVKQLNGETIWTLTFRGAGDKAFWEMIDGAPSTDQERAAVISEYIRLQRDLVFENAGSDAVMRIPLYNEMSDYAVAGLLDLPQGTNIIWNYVSARRDHYPPIGIENISIPSDQPIGLYFNFQFTSTGAHVAQAEGPWKMEANFRFFDELQAKPLQFSLVNAGNVREFPLGLSANARMMQNLKSYDSDTFLQTYCRIYFGEDHAAVVAEQYRDFFDSYWIQHSETRPGFKRQFIFQDLRCSRALRDLIAVLEKGTTSTNPFSAHESYYMIDSSYNGASNPLEALIIGMQTSGTAFSKVAADCDATRTEISAAKQSFYNDSLRLQAHFMENISESVRAAALAVQAEPGSSNRMACVQKALQYFQEARVFLHEAEHDRFDPWYPLAGKKDVFNFDSIEADLTRLAQNSSN